MGGNLSAIRNISKKMGIPLDCASNRSQLDVKETIVADDAAVM